ncbi:hypothetical protein GKZ68_09925 [Hymenobacter sp. BRD128]|uniref:hypothetical protein n=1 Tax=Hymenobacter sp. BRD128 TaxID=2675878 RepID=UPI00156641CD|nr:hypothetical protein [Hymenobacter sp. BRD128]QKG56917.1 hypothetical protein GKZ68_09925 [Hymenobacter sp. BRD128]
MLRALLTWLLLLNYLLVVGAGLVVSRPPEPLFSAAHPYVHSKDCQQHNYLRLDCFERCNGDQTEVHRRLPTGTGLHYLAQLKGLDVHCPAAAQAVVTIPVRWLVASQHPAPTRSLLPAGFGGRDYPPPQCG